MLMLPRIAFVVLLVLVTTMLIASHGMLPNPVATHFGTGGFANGGMSRDGYTLFMLAFAVPFPLLVVAVLGALPAIAHSPRNIPNHAYWFAPERRDASAARLLSYACVAGCIMVGFFAGMHWLLMAANADRPPRLNEPAFFALLVAFLICLAIWIVVMRRMFARPG